MRYRKKSFIVRMTMDMAILLFILVVVLLLSLPASAQNTETTQTTQDWLEQMMLKNSQQMQQLKTEPWTDAIGQLSDVLPGGQKPAINPLLVFVSFSMPEKSLLALLKQARKAGGTVILRGLVNNSFRDTRHAVARLVQSQQAQGGNVMAEPLSGFSVDPKLYHLFGIEAVPSFVVMKQPLAPCLDEHCHEAVPDHDRITGNMSLNEALHLLVRDGDYPALSRGYLAALQGERP